jgi:hypothetical protein
MELAIWGDRAIAIDPALLSYQWITACCCVAADESPKAV